MPKTDSRGGYKTRQVTGSLSLGDAPDPLLPALVFPWWVYDGWW